MDESGRERRLPPSVHVETDDIDLDPGWQSLKEDLRIPGHFLAEVTVRDTALKVAYLYEDVPINNGPETEQYPAMSKVFAGNEHHLVEITDLVEGVLDEAIYNAIEQAQKENYL